jgi:hypothetical protein
MQWPTFIEVQFADHEQLARWHRFLPAAKTYEQTRLMDYISRRLQNLGGITPELSEKIGWDEPEDFKLT